MWTLREPATMDWGISLLLLFRVTGFGEKVFCREVGT
jgi:hypothetical protein